MTSFLNLKIFDILGKEITDLVFGEKITGNYEVNFDASEFNLSSGIYFYQLRAGNYFQSKKMVYLK